MIHFIISVELIQYQDIEPQISSVLNSLTHGNEDTRNPEEFTKDIDPFKEAIKQMTTHTLGLVSSTDSGDTFRNVSIDSTPVNLIADIIKEKAEDLIKTTLQLTRVKSSTGKVSAISGTWQTVAAAATLLDTPPR